MQQANHIVHDDAKRLAAGLCIAMRDLHRDLFVRTDQHRRLVAVVIDQRIVQSAIGRAGIERDVGKAETLDQIGDDVRLPARKGWRRNSFSGINAPALQ